VGVSETTDAPAGVGGAGPVAGHTGMHEGRAGGGGGVLETK